MIGSVSGLAAFAPEVAAIVFVAFAATWLYAGDFERYSIFTLGVFKRVTHEPTTLNGEECREHWCEATDSAGERRLWFKEIVLFGIPVASYDGGEAYYCDDHAHVAIQTGEFQESRSVPDSVIWAIVWIAEKFAFDVEAPEESDFTPVDNVTTNASQAMSLIPIAFLVLFAAGAMKLMGANR
jgi:hypothetical protein